MTDIDETKIMHDFISWNSRTLRYLAIMLNNVFATKLNVPTIRRKDIREVRKHNQNEDDFETEQRVMRKKYAKGGRNKNLHTSIDKALNTTLKIQTEICQR